MKWPNSMKDSWGSLKGRYVLINLLIVATVVVTTFTLSIRSISIHYDRAACNSFGEQSNRTVKFVFYTYWRWDCLTPTNDGKWISTKNLREFGDDR